MSSLVVIHKVAVGHIGQLLAVAVLAALGGHYPVCDQVRQERRPCNAYATRKLSCARLVCQSTAQQHFHAMHQLMHRDSLHVAADCLHTACMCAWVEQHKML